jgi:hypothetical protein
MLKSVPKLRMDDKILPEDIPNDTSIGLIDILDKIALAKDQGLLNEEAFLIYLRFRKITQ